MTGNPYIQPQNDEPQDWRQLVQENGSLQAIIGELLIKNQKLRWELQVRECWPAQDPKLLMASEGTPLRKNARTAGMP
jgi:hypothetical protein